MIVLLYIFILPSPRVFLTLRMLFNIRVLTIIYMRVILSNNSLCTGP